MTGLCGKRLIALMIFGALSIVGCTGNMVHPTKDSSEWGRDHAECERTVREAMREEPSAGEPDLHDYSEENRRIRDCMRKKGWRFKW